MWIRMSVIAASAIPRLGAELEKPFEYFVAPSTDANKRNSEADMLITKDGRVMLAWTEFYTSEGSDWGKARIAGMIEGRPDWCISRQRTWGVPIALFFDTLTGEPHPETPALMRQVADLVEREGVEAWYSLDPATLLGADAAKYEKVTDILDVWFDSGVTHACVLARRPQDGLHKPAELYLEGSDQHRGWFQSSLLTGVAMDGVAPYLGCLTHGFTLDENGRKMSKSLGNTTEPQKVIAQSGREALPPAPFPNSASKKAAQASAGSAFFA